MEHSETSSNKFLIGTFLVELVRVLLDIIPINSKLSIEILQLIGIVLVHVLEVLTRSATDDLLCRVALAAEKFKWAVRVLSFEALPNFRHFLPEAMFLDVS